MTSAGPPIAVLGTAWSECENWQARKVGLFGLRRQTVAAPRRFLDWTVDGEPLRDRLTFPDGTPCRDITPFLEGEEGDPFADANVKALLSEGGEGRDPWVRYFDGRVGLLFCPQCFGLDCGAVSAEVVVGGSTVEWRDIAYQDGMTEAVATAEVPSFSLRFDRAAYEATVRALLTRWGSPPRD